jgi:hypothetical protein
MSEKTGRRSGRGTEEIVKVTIWLPDQEALGKVMAVAKVHLGCGGPRPESDGTYRIELYASPIEANKIIALDYRNEVDENYGQVVAERLKEVSTIDRFKGGKVKPVGIGDKRR